MECTTSYTFPVQTGGVFYFPWHRHHIEGTDWFYVSPPKDTGKAGKTELPKFRSEVAASGFEPRTTRSPVQRSTPLGHRPSLLSRITSSGGVTPFIDRLVPSVWSSAGASCSVPASVVQSFRLRFNLVRTLTNIAS